MASTVLPMMGGENKLGLLAYIPLSKWTTYADTSARDPANATNINEGIVDTNCFAIRDNTLVCLKTCNVKISIISVIGGPSGAIEDAASNEAYISLNGTRLLAAGPSGGDGTWYSGHVLYTRRGTLDTTLNAGDVITRNAESYWTIPPQIVIEKA